MHTCNIVKEKETMNLNESKGCTWEEHEEGKGKGKLCVKINTSIKCTNIYSPLYNTKIEYQIDASITKGSDRELIFHKITNTL